MVLIREPTPQLPMVPPPSPSPSPHFALDDLDLGPNVRLTRFHPDFDAFFSVAVEGADGKLYLAYGTEKLPEMWGHTGEITSGFGVFDGSSVRPIDLMAMGDKDYVGLEGRVDFVGFSDGVPVVRDENGKGEHYFLLSANGPAAASKPYVISQRSSPCVPFGGGRICESTKGRWSAIDFEVPGRKPVLMAGAIYTVDERSTSIPDTGIVHSVVAHGDVQVEGGGRHVFLVTEYHPRQGTAECLVGEIILR